MGALVKPIFAALKDIISEVSRFSMESIFVDQFCPLSGEAYAYHRIRKRFKIL